MNRLVAENHFSPVDIGPLTFFHHDHIAAGNICGLLRKQSIFCDLSFAELKLLAHLFLEIRFLPGQLVSRDELRTPGYCLILEGKVNLELVTEPGHSILIRSIDPATEPESSWLIEPCYSHIKPKAVMPTRVLFFHESTLMQQGGLGFYLTRQLAKRITEAAVESLKITQENLLQRAGNDDCLQSGD